MKIFYIICSWDYKPHKTTSREFICDGLTKDEAEEKVKHLLQEIVDMNNFKMLTVQITMPYEIF